MRFLRILNSRRFRLVLLSLTAPVIFLVLVEWFLVITNLVPSTRPLMRVTHMGDEYIVTNPRFGERFFTRAGVPVLSPVFARSIPNPDVPRILMLGESAAQGFPTPEFNLARVVEEAWRIRHPDQPVEVINLTMTGINSHVLRLLVHEAMILQPQIVILYAGHNEVIGPFGPAGVFGRSTVSTRIIRGLIWLRGLRISQAMASGWAGLSVFLGQEQKPWLGLNEFTEAPLAADDSRLDLVARHLESNLINMMNVSAQHGAKFILGIPAVNLNDWPPLGSADSDIDDEKAVALWREGKTDSLKSALQVYRLAQHEEHQNNLNEAAGLYRYACELDLFRFRADRRIVRAIRSAAASAPRDEIKVADIDGAIHGIEKPWRDHDYFFEHVHLTFRGLALAAASFVSVMEEVIKPGKAMADSSSQPFNEQQLADALLYTDWSEMEANQSIRTLLNSPIFQQQPGHVEKVKGVERKLEELERQIRNRGSPEMVIMNYQKTKAHKLADYMLHYVAGKCFMYYGRSDLARDAFLSALSINPYYADAHIRLGSLYLRTGDLLLAENSLKTGQTIQSYHPDIAGQLGLLYARLGRFKEAQNYLEKAIRIRPADIDSIANLAMVYEQENQYDAAIDLYRKGISLNERQDQLLNNLAWLLATLPDRNASERMESVNLALRANEVVPNYYRYLGTLAVAYQANGQRDKALVVAGQAIAGATRAGDSNALSVLKTKLK